MKILERAAVALVLLVFGISAIQGGVPAGLWRVLSQARPWSWEWARLVAPAIHALTYALVVAGLGGSLRGWMRLRVRNVPARWTMAAAAGVGTLGMVVLALDLLGLGQSGEIRIAYLMLALGSFIVIARSDLQWVARLNVSSFPQVGIFVWFAAAWCGVMFVGDLLAPEGFWDALVYHLGVPARILEWHKYLTAPPFFGDTPLLASMTYQVGLAVSGEATARGFAIVLSGLLLTAVWRIGRTWIGADRIWLPLAVAGSLPVVGLLIPHAGSDVLTALFSLLGLYALIEACPQWPRGRSRPMWLIVAGCFAGLAVSTKLVGALSGAVLLLLLAPYAESFGWFLLPAGVCFGPWAVKAWLQTGDPVFPFGLSPWRSPLWAPFSRQAYGDELLHLWGQLTLKDFVIGPEAQGVVSRFRLGWFGPVPVLAVLGMYGFWSTARKGRVPFLFASALAAMWACSAPAFRYYLPGLLLLPMILAGRPAAAPRWALLGGVVLNLAWLPLAIHHVDSPWPAARGEMDRSDYYRSLHVNVSEDAYEFIAWHARPGPAARILMVGEVRNYLAPAWSVVPSYFEPTLLLTLATDSATSDRLYIRLRQHGIRYLAVNVPELIRERVDAGLAWDGPVRGEIVKQFFADHAFLAYARSATWVYALGEKERGGEVPECLLSRQKLGDAGGYLLATLTQEAVALGRMAEAQRYGWAAVASAPHSGLVWASLGDALFAAKRWDQAVGAYSQAMYYNWKTSAVYRNQGMAFAQQQQYSPAQKALTFARDIDPDSRRLRDDFDGVWAEWWKRQRRNYPAP